MDNPEWILLSVGFVLITIAQVLIFTLANRARGRSDTLKNAIKIEELEAEIINLSHRITRASKRDAAEKSVDAREEAKSLKDQAYAHLAKENASEGTTGRPSVVTFPRGSR